MAPGRVTARQLWVVTESIHAVTYFAPACRGALRDAGLRGFWDGYFAARAAPLGAVAAGPVVAAFYNFHPSMVQRAIPSCWRVTGPAELVVIRAAAAAAARFDLVAPDVRSAMEATLPALRVVSAHCAADGRVMAGANRVVWPSVAVALGRRGLGARRAAMAELWQACTTVREHRGDGHAGALLTHGLSGLEAHLLAAGTQGLPPDVLRQNRGWSDHEWAGGTAVLVGRGLLHPDGRATEAGHRLRQSVEAMTDAMAEQPFAPLSDAAIDALYGVLVRGAALIQASGVFPFPNPMGLPELPTLSDRSTSSAVPERPDR